MRLNRAAAAIATVAIASAAIVSGCGVTHQGAVSVTRPAQHQASAHPVSTHRAQLTAVQRPPPADPSLAWQTEAHAPTVANHLVFEADARVVRAQARKILRTRALLPKHNRAAYKRMLNDFITVANLLQPGPGDGTTHQDYVAWYQALHASNITVY